VRLLLDRGADIESGDKEHAGTLLSYDAILRHEAVTRLLLDRGAGIESKDKDGWTLAVEGRRGRARGSCAAARQGRRHRVEDTRNQVVITDYYKGTYSPLTLYSIERKRK
jgi:hypothetical protein